MRRFLFLPVTAFFCASAAAQTTEKIETDRPDQTETPFIVPKKFFQAEVGFNREAYANDVNQFLHPTLLLKYGLNNRLELRLEATYLTRAETFIPQTKTTSLLEPVEIGAKIRLTEERGLRPKTSLIVHFGMPFIADKEYHTDPVNFSARLTAQNTLSETVALGYNLGVEGGGPGTVSAFYTVAPGVNLGAKWYAYVEAFGSFANGYNEHNVDGGLAYNLSNDSKLDVSAGFGLGPSPLKHYVALGFSFRLPVR